ncbi:MAG: FAD-dependent oxidoreductase [Oscillospiraceae bacterium]|nr:FAD-dependent oxidoreductase [Oscillospiraceae bacterium]
MKLVNRISSVNSEKCVGCRTCEMHCPSGAIKVRSGIGEEGFVSPCQKTCPAGINISGYIALAAAGRYVDAYRLIRRDNPFPSVCGRICTHECQKACNRCNFDSSVAIRDIKRFVADKAFEGTVPLENVWPKNGKKVSIIGAGPSGLTCAYYLALSGCTVDVYDAAPTAGGILTYGIPKWRLPKDVIEREVKAIAAVGVNIHLNTEIGRDKSFGALREESDAVYIATGTQFSRKAGVKGEDLPGVTHGLDFLRSVNSGNAPDLCGKKVVVIGGGNTAMDASRTARRLGAADVSVVYRRREVDMPADPREAMEAKEEKVKFITLASPLEFVGIGRVESVRCARMAVGEKDAKGRRGTVNTGEEFTVPADVVIVAVSQYSDFPFIGREEVEMTEWGKLIVDDEMMTSLPGVFAGGDVARGSATAIAAIADGRHAAEKIALHLALPTGINRGTEIDLPPISEKKVNYKASGKMRNLSAADRVNSEEEVALGLTEEMLQFEAARCYRCSGKASVDRERCVDCGMCWEHCNYGAVEMVQLEKPIIHTVPPVVEPEYYDTIKAILKEVHHYPNEPLCNCSMATAWEVVYAILKGAHTYEDLTVATGIRSGCSIYCIGDTLEIFEAAGYPQTPPENGNWHTPKVNLYNLSEEACATDPNIHLHQAQSLIWNEERFESSWAKFIKKQEAMKNGQKH